MRAVTPARIDRLKLHIIAVGAMKSGPERDLFDDYAGRFRKSGKQLGFRGLTEVEVASGGGLQAEAMRIVAKIPAGARLIRLDEHGAQRKSIAFAKEIARLRDSGESDLVFLIGGAEGYGEAVKTAAPDTLSFGAATWPHKMVRAMLAEQLYRAASILAGTAYHKP